MKSRSVLRRLGVLGLAADERGLTLIEVMATALIVALLAAAAATALISTAQASGHEQFESEANALAAQDLEQMRGLSDTQLYALQNVQSNGQTVAARSHTVQLAGITFTVTSTVKLASATNTTSCSASSASYYETTSSVTWTEGNQPQSVSENSVLTRPVYGTLAIQVLDTSNNPILGVSVTASTTTSTGTVQQASLTNSGGCVIFAGLPPGNYTIDLVKSGYVDVNANGSSSSDPSVNTLPVQEEGTSKTYQLGQISGPITATYQAGSGAAGQADGLSWSTTGMAANGTSSPGVYPAAGGTTASTGTSSTDPLYPASYSVWAGRCLAQEPSTPTGVSVSAGGAGTPSPVTISEPTLKLTTVYWKTSTNGSSTAIVPAHLVLTFNDGAGCVDSWPATVATPSSGTTPPATGWFADPGQPYAPANDLTICADYRASSSSSYYWSSVVLSSATSLTTTNNVPAITITQGTNAGQCPVQS